KIYYTDRFLKSKKLLGANHELVRWLEPKYQKVVREPFHTFAKKLIFEHSDLSNPNIVIDVDGNTFKIGFVDWGSAHFSYSGPEFYIGYMTQLVDFMADYRDELIEYVAKKFNLDPAEFLRSTTEFRKELKVGDIIWAVMMYALCHNGELGQDEKKYLEISNKRIKEYEDEFGSG
ncbi:MAG TPA: hypothetical protein VLE69_01070, partial [Candidatus Saccharimonadales bacterium]|nr:hypothetical protein [Candidatus Saccharimonadales bacterium]